MAEKVGGRDCEQEYVNIENIVGLRHKIINKLKNVTPRPELQLNCRTLA